MGRAQKKPETEDPNNPGDYLDKKDNPIDKILNPKPRSLNTFTEETLGEALRRHGLFKKGENT